MKKIKNRSEEAYNGKYVTFRGKLHQLVPQEVKGMCQGCALYYSNCPDNITKLCTQGFILKKVKL